MKNETHIRYADSSIERVKKWNISEQEKKNVKKFLEDYTNGKVTQRIPNNPDALIERLTQLLRPALENIGSPITKEEVEKFFTELVVKQKIKSFNQKTQKYSSAPYSIKTQIGIISTLKNYLNWIYKNPLLIEPLNIKIQKKEADIESLKLGEIEKLYKGCKSDEERYILSGLFSTGARAEEFMSLRMEDITLPEKDGFIKVQIRNATSKTKGRTISLYWTPTLECFPYFLRQRREEGAKPSDFVLTRNYVSVRRWIRRLGQRVLEKDVYPHIFRHACADWLASRLNRQQMCIYFGWAFSSKMPDVYINRQNVNMQEVDEKVASGNYQELKDKMAKQEYDAKLKNEELEELKKKIDNSISKDDIDNYIEQNFAKQISEIKEKLMAENMKLLQSAKVKGNTIKITKIIED